MFPKLVRTLICKEAVSVNRYLKCTSSHYVYRTHSSHVEGKLENNDWHPVYKLPVIGWAAALSKIKVYQVGLTTIAVPASFAIQWAGILPEGTCAAVAALGITGSITLFAVSYFAQNLIGIIYVDSSKERIRISYLDFWGKRKNLECRADELDPPSEKLKFGFLATVKTNNMGTYKLLRRMGEVKEPEVFAYYFGE